MRYLPSFRALRCFEVCARTGTLSAAARELNVTPGAISRQITALEDQLGVPLMHRHHHGVTLNARGRQLATRLQSAFAAIGEAVDEAVVEPEDSTLTVNLFPTFAIQWLMPRLPAFYAVAPDVDIRIRPSLQARPLDRKEIDVALSIGDPSDKSLVSRYIFERRFTPVCSPTTLERTSPLTPAALEKLQIFFSDMHIQQWRMWAEATGLGDLDPGAMACDSRTPRWPTRPRAKGSASPSVSRRCCATIWRPDAWSRRSRKSSGPTSPMLSSAARPTRTSPSSSASWTG